jgi:hypothetical protein
VENPVEDKDLEIIAHMKAFSQEMESIDELEEYTGYSIQVLMDEGLKLIHRLDGERRRYDNYYRAVSMAFRSSQMREMRGSFSHEDFDVMVSKICGGTYPDATTTFKGE